jgi:hypothetical protein
LEVQHLPKMNHYNLHSLATIPYLTSFFTWLFICIVHVWSPMHAQGWVHGFLFNLSFCLQHVLLYVPPQVGPKPLNLHLLTLELTHYICGQPLDPTRTHLFGCSYGEDNYILWCHSRCLYLHHEKLGVLCFAWANSCPSTTFCLVFLPTSWHHVISGWNSNLGQHGHCWSHLNGLVSYYISACNVGSSSKGRTLPWLTLGECVSSFATKVFGCLHQYANNFIHWCVNMVCLAKGNGDLFWQLYGHVISKWYW